MKKLTRTPIVYLLLLPMIATFIGGCQSAHKRFQPSGLNSSFNLAPARPFSDYVSHYQTIIEKTRTDLDQPDRNLIISANQPFELIPDQESFPRTSSGKFRRGIVLIHGLSDSPYHMKYLAEYFRDRGFLVRVLLLPGHGTVPGDMTKVNSRDWHAVTDYGIGATRPLVDSLYLGGYSTGGSLSLLYASKHPEEISGLFLYPPCVKIKTRWAYLTGIAGKFFTWLRQNNDLDFARYESFAVNGANQVYRLTSEIEETLVEKNKKVAVPTFVTMSWEDETVDSASTLDFFNQHLTSSSSRLLLFSAAEAPSKTAPRIIQLDSKAIPEKILSFSHMSILIPPEDTHYGANGDYRNCLHYDNDSDEFNKCSSGDNNWLGEWSNENLSKGILQRMTWNPLFQKMLDEQDRFLADLP